MPILPKDNKMGSTVISLNVNHSSMLGGLRPFLEQFKPELVFLQELSMDGEQLNSKIQGLGYKCNVSLSLDTGVGVGVVYSDTVRVLEIHALSPGRLLHVRLESISFFNLYAPSGNGGRQERARFFGETVFRNLAACRVLPVLIGDFNCVLNRIDTMENFNLKKCAPLQDLINTFRYVDGFRALHPIALEFTWSRPRLSPSRLDRIYVPPHLASLLQEVSHEATLSDHKLVLVRLEVNLEKILVPKRELAPVWRMNTSILEDSDFREQFPVFWETITCVRESMADIGEFWEFAKQKIAGFCRAFSIMKAKSRRDTKSYLFACLDLALQAEDWEEVAMLRERIRAILNYEATGFMVRSREKENAEEEEASLFHAARELKKGGKGSWTQLLTAGGPTSDPTEAAEAVNSFFSALFNGQHRSQPGNPDPVDTGIPFIPDFSEVGDFLEGLDTLSGAERDSLTGEVTLEEIEAALKTCASRRSPGLDGLPYELYRVMFPVLGETLREVFNLQLERGELIPSNKMGVTRLLNKVEGAPMVGQLRPITLLCTDYKILSKVLVARLTPVLPTVLTTGQLCSNPPLNIQCGGLALQSAIDYINMNNIPSYFVSFDIFKAYDKTVIQFIAMVMEAMGFPADFIGWIRALHSEVSTRMMVLGHLGEPIPVNISLRQGDPLAMPLFLLNMQPFLAYLDRRVKGIRVGSVQQRLEAYVDDVNLISESVDDLTVINEAFLKFERVSGTVLNRSQKSKIMGLGPWADRGEWPLPWLKVCPSLKVFGITYHRTYKDTLNITWEACLTGVRRTLMSWGSRLLPTLRQRVKVLNTFALSKLWYLAQVFPPPQRVVDQLEILVRRFLWIGRLEHLALDELINPPRQGGLGVIVIRAKADALLVKQTSRILGTRGKYFNIMGYWLGLKLRPHFPLLAQGPNAQVISPLMVHVGDLVKEVLEQDLLQPDQCMQVKTKELYKGYTDSPPPPKIVNKYPGVNWMVVWKRLESPVLTAEARDHLFTIINNIYPTKERLFKLNQHPTGNCPHCRGTTETIIHLFTECSYTQPLWGFVKMGIQRCLGGTTLLSSFDLLFLNFQKSNRDNLILFLVSNYVLYIIECLRAQSCPLVNVFKGFLKYKHAQYVNKNLPNLGVLPF